MRVDPIHEAITPTASNPKFIAWWTVVTVASHQAVALTYALVNNFRPGGTRGWSIATLIGIIVGVLLLGIMQGYVLTRYVPRFNWVRWVLFTLGAYMLMISFVATWIWMEAMAKSQASTQNTIGSDYAGPDVMTRVLIYFLMLVLLMCLQGAIVGLVQSRVLRLKQPFSDGWIRINIAVTPLSAFFLSIAILGMDEYRGYEMYSMLFAVLGATLAGVSTGQTLVRYMHPVSAP